MKKYGFMDYGFSLFLLLFVLFAYFIIHLQELEQNDIKVTAEVSDAKVVNVYYSGKSHKVNYMYYNKFLDSCVMGTNYWAFEYRVPKIGERYKVFYNKENEYLSVKDWLVRYSDEGLEINNDFYQIDDTITSFRLDDIMPPICPIPDLLFKPVKIEITIEKETMVYLPVEYNDDKFVLIDKILDK